MSVLVRSHAWWFNKLPLSVTLMLLLLDGHDATVHAIVASASLLVAVSAVANYGYALNELFDVEEDAAASRPNQAAGRSRLRFALVIAGSASVAVAAAAAAAGWAGAALAAVELCLPLAYSIPPVRIKERGWLGVAADASAAHVYPALLGLLTVQRVDSALLSTPLIAAVLVWATATGLRGILSHQLATAERDEAGGLTTVVHRIGRAPLERAVIVGLLPAEVVAFAVAVLLSRAGPLALVLLAAYLAYECVRTRSGAHTVRVFRPEGQPYIPFVEESLYKAWGPVVFAADAAMHDARWLVVLPLYALAFRPHLRAERRRVRSVVRPPHTA
ncbi:MAG: UbiA family prenyltransferase [Gaiellaceae bacterium]